jgi:23S rRNA pseudouridine1911/1915/1917 synthase
MDTEQTSLQLVVAPDQANDRIDRYLAAALPDLSRSYAQQLIQDAHVRVNGKLIKPSYLVQLGDQISVTLPLPKPSDIIPQNLPLTIVYEDDDLLVVDKPAGMVVHPAPGHTTDTLVNVLIHHYPMMHIGDDLRPGIIHRLDRDTSGLLVVAKHDRAKTCLQAQQQARLMLKVYLALIHGHFRELQGVIDAPIDRHPVDRLRMAVVSSGRSARTFYRTCEILGPYSLVEVRLDTGRTHQIRVHFNHKHHPIVGDPLYGGKNPALGLTRQFLHAHRLGFRRLDNQWIECVSPLPLDLQAVLDRLRLQSRPEQLQAFDPEQPWWQQSEV